MTKETTKNFEFRLYPNKSQKKAIEASLEACKDLYNAVLEEKIRAYKEDDTNLNAFDLINRRKELAAKKNIDISILYSQVSYNVCQRVDNAFTQFYRRCKRKAKDDKPGFPRFKSSSRYNSFTYPQQGFKFVDDKHFYLSKIGTVKIVKHRELPAGAKVKTCTVKRNALGQIFVVLSVVYSVEVPKTSCSGLVGIDVGCEKFATLSTGEKIAHPHFYRQTESKLAKAQSRWDKLKTRRNDDKQKIKAKRHKNKLDVKVANQRKYFLHKTSRSLVNREFGTFYVEDLNIKGMTKDNYRNLNKSILDSGWGNFLDMLTYKAEEAGKKVVRVNPAYTSQICSGCGWMVKKSLSVRQHECPHCGLSIDRDVNAALNILSFGTKLSGSDTGRSL